MSYSWHWEWKNLFPANCREIRVGGHQADCKIGPMVIEFQHSKIPPQEIQQRERHYGQMIWIFDARNLDLNWSAVESRDRTRFFVEWKCSQASDWSNARKPVLLHLGGWDLIWIHHSDERAGFGNGFYVQRPILVERFLSQNFKPPLTNLYRNELRES